MPPAEGGGMEINMKNEIERQKCRIHSWEHLGKTYNNPILMVQKECAKAVNEKSVEMIHVKDINAVTGYIRGCCTALGMKKEYPTIIHESALDCPYICVSAGKLGVQLKLSPQDFIKATGAKALDIIHHNS